MRNLWSCYIALSFASLWALWGTAGLKGAVLADSVLDWESSLLNNGTVEQGEFRWEYGYISNYAGAGGIFYGWHPNFYYWAKPTSVIIYWPPGQQTPDQAWGEGGDSTGCRPPMSWKDGGYPWADVQSDHWASVRRWTSNYTGLVHIYGSFGRYFSPNQVTGWDVTFSVAINANELIDPVIYSKTILWNDGTQYSYSIPNVPVRVGDTVCFIINAAGWNANNCYIRFTATIEDTPYIKSDLNKDLYVDFYDLSVIGSQWGLQICMSPDWCGGADLNQDGRVNVDDMALFAAQWLECLDTNPPCNYVRP